MLERMKMEIQINLKWKPNCTKKPRSMVAKHNVKALRIELLNQINYGIHNLNSNPTLYTTISLARSKCVVSYIGRHIRTDSKLSPNFVLLA